MAEVHKYEVVSYDKGNIVVDGTITVKENGKLEFEPKGLEQQFSAVYIPTLHGTLSLQDGEQFVEACMHQRYKSGYSGIRKAKEI